ncbi:down syndrome cell adhesion molecule [Caerostris darwini]|uniref:Down syndrome cell adhesion molecule n=1 Tax=Caerostris darwini TaxID=1538125 RepID=A0AAV4P9B3_9ARAC|nr:down syndrome cell adhesion molecule [Caerostris darwini]
MTGTCDIGYIATGSQLHNPRDPVCYRRDNISIDKKQKSATVDCSYNDRYVVYPWGELHIKTVDYSDSHFMYKCQVRNSLTRQSKESISGGRLIVTDPSVGHNLIT